VHNQDKEQFKGTSRSTRSQITKKERCEEEGRKKDGLVGDFQGRKGGSKSGKVRTKERNSDNVDNSSKFYIDDSTYVDNSSFVAVGIIRERRKGAIKESEKKKKKQSDKKKKS
jgi:hypothetical protein